MVSGDISRPVNFPSSVAEADGARFLFEKNRIEITSIFNELGYDISQCTLQEMYEIAHTWTQGDHWNLQNTLQLDSTSQQQLMAKFDQMGLVDQVLPSGGTYDHLIILGGTMLGNIRRAQFTKELLDTNTVQIARGGDVWFLAGQRPRLERETPELINAQGQLNSQNDADLWTNFQSDLETKDDWNRSFATETELARLSILATFGSLRLKYSHLQLGLQRPVPGVPFRAITHKSFQLTNGKNKLDLKILNAAAVQRPQGPARHTTSSSASEWVRYARPQKDARVLVINNNPHIARSQADVKKVFIQEGQPDLQLETAGPAALTVTPAQVYLGEIARIIYGANAN